MGQTTRPINNIRDASNKTKEKYRNLHNNVTRDDYWEGQGVEALKKKYQRITGDMDRQSNKLAGLIRDYQGLQSAVDRAEPERLRKMEEARVKACRRH